MKGKNFHTFHLLLSSLLLTHSALSLLIALVPSARLIDQKGSECSSMFAWLNSGQPEPSYFSPRLPAPLSNTSTHSSSVSSFSLSFCLFHCRSLFYIPLHFNTYTLGNIPDSISHGRKNDIYVARKNWFATSQQQKKKSGWKDCRESWRSETWGKPFISF